MAIHDQKPTGGISAQFGLLTGALLLAVCLAAFISPLTRPAAARPEGSVPVVSAAAHPARILLRPDMITSEEAREDAGMLVDEQPAIADSAGAQPGVPVTLWRPGWKAETYPANAFIDLGADHVVSTIYLYDAHGKGDIVVSAGTPFHWQPLFTDPMKNYRHWNRHDVHVRTRYVRITLTSPTSTPEIVLCGAKTADPPAAYVRAALPAGGPAPTPRPTMDQFIGINSFIDVPLAVDEAAGFIREYHNWRWNEGKADGLIRHNPSFPGWDFDRYYADRRQRCITVMPCIQGSVKWLTTGDETKPLPEGANPRDPFSYALHARFMFQYAARYGSSRVDAARLKTDAGHADLAGLDMVHYYEDWNEPNKDWFGREAQFLPYEYAAMASADYDGHQGKMGTAYGVKNADPRATFVMAGLAGLKLDYVKAMKAWSDAHRNGSFPADVLNFHHYSRTGKGSRQVGISPEQDSLKEQMEAVVAFRDRYLPGKEIWLSEFGYDVHPASPQRAPAIGSFPAAEVQGQWLVRTYLALAASGIERAMMYMIRDHDTRAGGKYATSGLVTDKASGQKPRTAWYYVYTLKNALAGTRFVQEVPSGRPNVKIYRFRHERGNREVYAVWCPTSNQTYIRQYFLQLPGHLRPVRADLIALADGDTDGDTTRLRVAGGGVTIPVGERPVFVSVTPGEAGKSTEK